MGEGRRESSEGVGYGRKEQKEEDESAAEAKEYCKLLLPLVSCPRGLLVVYLLPAATQFALLISQPIRCRSPPLVPFFVAALVLGKKRPKGLRSRGSCLPLDSASSPSPKWPGTSRAKSLVAASDHAGHRERRFPPRRNAPSMIAFLVKLSGRSRKSASEKGGPWYSRFLRHAEIPELLLWTSKMSAKEFGQRRSCPWHSGWENARDQGQRRASSSAEVTLDSCRMWRMIEGTGFIGNPWITRWSLGWFTGRGYDISATVISIFTSGFRVELDPWQVSASGVLLATSRCIVTRAPQSKIRAKEHVARRIPTKSAKNRRQCDSAARHFRQPRVLRGQNCSLGYCIAQRCNDSWRIGVVRASVRSWIACRSVARNDDSSGHEEGTCSDTRTPLGRVVTPAVLYFHRYAIGDSYRAEESHGNLLLFLADQVDQLSALAEQMSCESRG